MERSITSKTILYRYKEVFIGSIHGLLYVYKPAAQKGVIVLPKIASDIYKLIDSQRSTQEIWKILKNNYSINHKSFIETVNNLISSEIIYFDIPKTNQIPNSMELGVWFHITNACNLRCKYCYINKTQSKMDSKIAFFSLKKIMSDAKTQGYKYLKIKFSGGEPLLELSLIRKLVEEGKKYAKKNKININFKILTNGVLITREVAEYLHKENINITVSLDGIDKYNDIQRIFPSRIGTSSKVIEGIAHLQKTGVSFGIATVITSKNIIDIPNFTKYLLSLGVPFSFSFYRTNNYSSDLYKPDNTFLIKNLKKSYKIISESSSNNSLLIGLLDRVNFAKKFISPCNIVIKHDGNIAICQMMMDDNAGSIYDDDIIRITNETRIKRFKSDDHGNKKCLTCLWRNICSGGCPLTISRMNYSVYCEAYKSLIPYLLKLEAQRVLKNSIQSW